MVSGGEGKLLFSHLDAATDATCGATSFKLANERRTTTKMCHKDKRQRKKKKGQVLPHESTRESEINNPLFHTIVECSLLLLLFLLSPIYFTAVCFFLFLMVSGP